MCYSQVEARSISGAWSPLVWQTLRMRYSDDILRSVLSTVYRLVLADPVRLALVRAQSTGVSFTEFALNFMVDYANELGLRGLMAHFAFRGGGGPIPGPAHGIAHLNNIAPEILERAELVWSRAERYVDFALTTRNYEVALSMESEGLACSRRTGRDFRHDFMKVLGLASPRRIFLGRANGGRGSAQKAMKMLDKMIEKALPLRHLGPADTLSIVLVDTSMGITPGYFRRIVGPYEKDWARFNF